MRIKIKTGSTARSAPQAVRPAPRGRPAPARPPLAVVGAKPGLLAPLVWPRTPGDVAWTSEPQFGRSPAGWYRIGFHA